LDFSRGITQLFRKAFLLSFCSVALAMAQFPPEVSFCPAGIQPDGYLDWSKLPAPSGNGAVTATIPVAGSGGVTATVTIPGNGVPPNGSGDYSVASPNQVRFGIVGDQNPLIIVFNQPVKAVSLNVRTTERFGHHIRILVNDVDGGTVSSTFPPQAQLDASGWDYPSEQTTVSPFQIVSRDANLTSVVIENLQVGESYYFDLLNFRVQTAAAPDRSSSVPKSGLLAWYRADQLLGKGGLDPYGAAVTQWPDASPNKGIATGQGTLNLDGPHCSPVMTNAVFNFSLPINGLTGMTVIMATNTYGNPSGSNNAALFWGETGGWGLNFFSPAQTTVNWRFGTGQAGNNPVYNRPANVAADFTVSSFVHNNSVDSLFVNAQPVSEVNNRYSTIANAGNTATIGASYNGSQPFPGGIGEVLIYNRALSNAERQAVELYLMSKYGVR
jgi:hypothetical protein